MINIVRKRATVKLIHSITCTGYVIAGGQLYHSRRCPMHGAPTPVTTSLAAWSNVVAR